MIRNTVLIVGGIGSWSLFALSIAGGGWGILGNWLGADVSNFLFFVSMAVSLPASWLFLHGLFKSGQLSFPTFAGLLALVFLSVLLVLAMLKFLRYS
ncbi:hypothetical protein LPB19_03510 [Marinobacter salinisoli]|uniref:Uncharacterized protein n=1 Tax=Marinobacter salinisoli TaxID=2769486 RepID=A0ABX7MSY5_9GAMM|nr:hypothetical protein [Marinobacter salinisoli]QSP95497.1 hypothetical protein LPB19_03510 [Marinobacter salinisoli]